MSAVPGGELAASLQRLIAEVSDIKVSQVQQAADLAAANLELNSLRINLPAACKSAVDEVNKTIAERISKLESDVGSFMNTKSAELKVEVGTFMSNSQTELKNEVSTFLSNSQMPDANRCRY